MSIKLLSPSAKFLIIGGLVLLCPALLAAQNYTGLPVTKDRLLQVIESKQLSVPSIVKKIKKSGVNFSLTDEVEEELRAVRANRLIIEAVGSNYRNTNPPRQTSARNTGRTNTGSSAGTPVVSNSGGGYSDENDSSEKYEQIYYQGLQVGSQIATATTQQQLASIAQSLKSLGEQGIRLDPTRPEAYKLLGTYWMMMGNFNEAERYGQEAINRGGDLAFKVYHMSGTPHVETLFVARGYITIESNQKYFHFVGSQVGGVQQWGQYTLPNGFSVAIFRVTTSKDGRIDQWDFSPSMGGTPDEAAMIMRLIQKNVR